jgi:hypothetical protein
VTHDEIEEALKPADEYGQVFREPAYLTLLAGVHEQEGWGHYHRHELFIDDRDGTYVGVEGGGCSCDGADAAWRAETLEEAVKSFSEYNRLEIETTLREKGLLQ